LQLIKASLVDGKKLMKEEVATKPEEVLDFQSADGVPYSMKVSVSNDKLQMVLLNEDSAVMDVIDTMGDAKPLDGCPRGLLYLVDDVIVPPSLKARILNLLDGGDSSCPQELEGGGPPAEPPVPVSTLLADANVTLEANNAKVSVPVTARVNAEAKDEDGNVLPLNSTLTLDVDADLKEIGAAEDGGCIQVQLRPTEMCFCLCNACYTAGNV
jgi:hypothetical protein